MEKLAAEPAAGEEHKLRTPRLPMSSFTCDLMSSAQCRGQGGRERAGKSQGSHLMSPVLLLKVMSTNLGNLSTNVGNLGNLSTNLGNLEIWEIWKIWEIWEIWKFRKFGNLGLCHPWCEKQRRDQTS